MANSVVQLRLIGSESEVHAAIALLNTVLDKAVVVQAPRRGKRGDEHIAYGSINLALVEVTPPPFGYDKREGEDGYDDA
jgi:hypothetical protein